MKDLDFDELDKAVNALTSQDTSAAKPSAPARPSPATPNRPVTPEPQSSQPAPRPTPHPAVTPPRRGARLGTKPAGSAPRRSQGGAIDIVAPKPPKPVSRTGATLKPPTHITPKEVVAEDLPAPKPRTTSPVAPAASATQSMPIHKPEPVAESPSQPTSPVPKPLVAPVSEPEVAPKPTVNAADFMNDDNEKWPDPLDFFSDETDQGDKKTHPAESELTPQDGGDKSTPSSPFIEGAKVEKRPLGAFAAAPKSEPGAQNGDEMPGLEPTQPLEPAPKPEPAPSSAASVSKPAPEATKPTTPKAVDEDHLLPAHTPAEDPAKTLHEAVREHATLAIPQQYKTEQKTPNDAVHHVFDTKDYHPPLIEDTAHAKRHKKRSWLAWLITIVVLVALGIALYVGFGYLFQQTNLINM